MIAFISAFLVGGFSEPADAVQITVLVFSLVVVWYRGSKPAGDRIRNLLAWTLAGALLSLVVMLISPANSQRLGDNPPTLMQLIHDAFYFSWVFMTKTVREMPLPTILSASMPAVLTWLYWSMAGVELSQPKNAGCG